MVPLEQVLAGIGARLAQARGEQGLTQEEAASLAGMDVKRWQRLEGGRVNPTIKTLVHAAQATQRDFWTLVGATAPAARKNPPGRPRARRHTP